jgi:hypothetical protein
MSTFDSGRRKALRAAVVLAACTSAGLRAASALGTTTSGDNVLPLGKFALEADTILPDARIAFKTHGRLNAVGGNFILIRDIAPVAGIMRVPDVIVVNPSLPKDGPEFIAYAKANPGKTWRQAAMGPRLMQSARCST